MFQGLLESAEQRTRRLFSSFDELDREVWGSASQPSISTPQSKTDADPCWYSLHSFGALWWDHWQTSLGRARSVQVPDDDISKEFREARRHGLGHDSSHEPGDRRQRKVVDDDKNWGYYQLRRASRHRWGQYLCSNMDWEWDLGACMERLFTAEKQIREGPSTAGRRTSASSIEIDMGVVPGESWSLMAKEVHGILPKEVKISYKTKDGRTQYMLFVPASSNPSPHHPVFGTSCSGSSAGEQEIESLHTTYIAPLTRMHHIPIHMKVLLVRPSTTIAKERRRYTMLDSMRFGWEKMRCQFACWTRPILKRAGFRA